jgi:hypothetical protein
VALGYLALSRVSAAADLPGGARVSRSNGGGNGGDHDPRPRIPVTEAA